MQGRKTGGRRKGTPNKRKERVRAVVAAANAAGEEPLDFMLRLMRDKTQTMEVRRDMAKAAAPYVHAKLASVEHSGKGGGPLQVQVVRFGDDPDSA